MKNQSGASSKNASSSASIRSSKRSAAGDKRSRSGAATPTESGESRRSSIFSFGKRRRDDDDEEEDNDEDSMINNLGGSDSEGSSGEDEEIDSVDELTPKTEQHVRKRRRRLSEIERQAKAEEEAKVAVREAALDAELEPQYRKFRPRGFKFNPPPQDRPVRIYADGVFDLFHLGHMRQLEQAKKALPNATLICGIPSDEDTHRHKGLTVLAAYQRAESLRHCKWVDEVIENAPWSVNEEFLRLHKIDYVAHDDLPYASAGDDDIYKPVKEKGMFLTTQRTEGVSTSDIITKIIRDYDKYLMRNFARGASRKELNVSWLKKNELDLKRHVNEFRESFKTGFEQARNRDLYSEIMGYISSHITPKKKAKSTIGGSSSASRPGSIRSGKSTARSKSPVTEFASKYTGGSLFGNMKGWVSRKMDSAPASQIHSPEESSASPEPVVHINPSDQTASASASTSS